MSVRPTVKDWNNKNEKGRKVRECRKETSGNSGSSRWPCEHKHGNSKKGKKNSFSVTLVKMFVHRGKNVVVYMPDLRVALQCCHREDDRVDLCDYLEEDPLGQSAHSSCRQTKTRYISIANDC